MKTIGMLTATATIALASSASAQLASHEEAVRWVEETALSLSLEEKVAQMVCEQMRGEYIADDADEFLYWSELVRDHGIGGFVVYGGTPQDTAHLLNRLQELARVPLLISADFEGGPGQQFTGASEFPANMALAASGSESLAYEVGRAGALEGRAIGIHLTYSPVVDVQTRPDNPVLSVRSFGKDVDLLGRMAAAYIRGYQENGMLATAKHYPGRGDVDMLDDEFLINRKPADRVEAEDLAAFRKAIDAGVTFVMSEHIIIPSITDGSNLPASVESQLASNWLRERLGFEGVLTTDDLWYPKVVERFGAERAGVLAIQAGHDALLKPLNAIKTIEAVVAAVREGEIPVERIDASAERLLYWKARLNLHRDRFVDVTKISSVVGSKEHTELVQEVAERSLTLLVNNDFFPSTVDGLGDVVHITLQKNANDAVPPLVANELASALPVRDTFQIRSDVSPAVYESAMRAARTADTVIVSLFRQRTVYVDNGVLPARQLEWLQRIIQANSRTVVMSYGNPYLVEGLRGAAAFAVGYGEGGFYGNQTVYAAAFIRLLKGEIEATGTLPVALAGGGS
jgi:beta-N-acetylhexosaminidase